MKERDTRPKLKTTVTLAVGVVVRPYNSCAGGDVIPDGLPREMKPSFQLLHKQRHAYVLAVNSVGRIGYL